MYVTGDIVNGIPHVLSVCEYTDAYVRVPLNTDGFIPIIRHTARHPFIQSALEYDMPVWVVEADARGGFVIVGRLIKE